MKKNFIFWSNSRKVEEINYLSIKKNCNIKKLHCMAFSINCAYAIFDNNFLAWIPQTENLYFDSLDYLLKEPIEFNNFGTRKILKIACNNFVVHAVSDDGLVYSWGNDREKNGALGLGLNYNQPSPILNLNFSNKKIIDISLSEKHAAALDINRQMYTWGTGNHGELGVLNLKNTNNPVQINMIKKFFIYKVQCGSNYTAGLDYQGNIFYFGIISPQDLLKNSSDSPDITLKHIDNVKSQEIFIGRNVLAMLDNSGKIYLFNEEDGLIKLKLENKIKSIKFVENNFYALTIDNKILYEFSQKKINNFSLNNYFEYKYFIEDDYISKFQILEMPYYVNLLFFLSEISTNNNETKRKIFKGENSFKTHRDKDKDRDSYYESMNNNSMNKNFSDDKKINNNYINNINININNSGANLVQNNLDDSNNLNDNNNSKIFNHIKIAIGSDSSKLGLNLNTAKLLNKNLNTLINENNPANKLQQNKGFLNEIEPNENNYLFKSLTPTNRNQNIVPNNDKQKGNSSRFNQSSNINRNHSNNISRTECMSPESSILKNLSNFSNASKLNSLVFPPNKKVKHDPLSNLNVSKYPDDYRNSFRINRISNLLGRIFNKKLDQIQNSRILNNISSNYSHLNTHQNDLSNAESYNSYLINNNIQSGKMYDSLSPNYRRRAEIEKINFDDFSNSGKMRRKSNNPHKDYINYENLTNKYFNKFFNENEEEKEIQMNNISNSRNPPDNEKIGIDINNILNSMNIRNINYKKNLSLVKEIKFELNTSKKNDLDEKNIIINNIDEIIYSEKSENLSSFTSSKNKFTNFNYDNLQISKINNEILFHQYENKEENKQCSTNLRMINIDDSFYIQNQVYNNINMSIFSSVNNSKLNQTNKITNSVAGINIPFTNNFAERTDNENVNTNISIMDNISIRENHKKENSINHLVSNINNESDSIDDDSNLNFDLMEKLNPNKNLLKNKDIFRTDHIIKKEETYSNLILETFQENSIDYNLNNINSSIATGKFPISNRNSDIGLNPTISLNNLNFNTTNNNETIKFITQIKDDENGNFPLANNSRSYINTSKISNGNNLIHNKNNSYRNSEIIINDQDNEEIRDTSKIIQENSENYNFVNDPNEKSDLYRKKPKCKNTNISYNNKISTGPYKTSEKNLEENSEKNGEIFFPENTYDKYYNSNKENKYKITASSNIFIEENKEEDEDLQNYDNEYEDKNENYEFEENNKNDEGDHNDILNSYNSIKNNSLNVISEEESNDMETINIDGSEEGNLVKSKSKNAENKELIKSQRSNRDANTKYLKNSTNFKKEDEIKNRKDLNFNDFLAEEFDKDENLKNSINENLHNPDFLDKNQMEYSNMIYQNKKKPPQINRLNNLSSPVNSSHIVSNQNEIKPVLFKREGCGEEYQKREEKLIRSNINIKSSTNSNAPIKLLQEEKQEIKSQEKLKKTHQNELKKSTISNQENEKKPIPGIKITSIARSRSKEKQTNPDSKRSNGSRDNKNEINPIFGNPSQKLVNNIMNSPNIKVIKKENLDENDNENSFSYISKTEPNTNINKFKRNLDQKKTTECEKVSNNTKNEINPNNSFNKFKRNIENKKTEDGEKSIKSIDRKMFIDEIGKIQNFIKHEIIDDIISQTLERIETKNKRCQNIDEKIIKSKKPKKEKNTESELNSSPVSIRNYQDTIDIETSLIKQIFEPGSKTKIVSGSLERKTNAYDKSEVSMFNQENLMVSKNNFTYENNNPLDKLDEEKSSSQNLQSPENNFIMSNNSNFNSISFIEVYSNSNSEIFNFDENRKFYSIDNTYGAGDLFNYVMEKQIYIQLNSIGPKKKQLQIGNQESSPNARNQNDFCNYNIYEKSELENITEYIDLENMSSISKSRISTTNLNNTILNQENENLTQTLENLNSSMKQNASIEKEIVNQMNFDNSHPINNFNSSLLNNLNISNRQNGKVASKNGQILKKQKNYSIYEDEEKNIFNTTQQKSEKKPNFSNSFKQSNGNAENLLQDIKDEEIFNKSKKFIISKELENQNEPYEEENKNGNSTKSIHFLHTKENNSNYLIPSSNSPMNLSGSFNSTDSKDCIKSLSARLEKLKKAKSDIIEKNKKIEEENNNNKQISELNINGVKENVCNNNSIKENTQPVENMEKFSNQIYLNNSLMIDSNRNENLFKNFITTNQNNMFNVINLNNNNITFKSEEELNQMSIENPNYANNKYKNNITIDQIREKFNENKMNDFIKIVEDENISKSGQSNKPRISAINQNKTKITINDESQRSSSKSILKITSSKIASPSVFSDYNNNFHSPSGQHEKPQNISNLNFTPMKLPNNSSKNQEGFDNEIHDSAKLSHTSNSLIVPDTKKMPRENINFDNLSTIKPNNNEKILLKNQTMINFPNSNPLKNHIKPKELFNDNYEGDLKMHFTTANNFHTNTIQNDLYSENSINENPNFYETLNYTYTNTSNFDSINMGNVNPEKEKTDVIDDAKNNRKMNDKKPTSEMKIIKNIKKDNTTKMLYNVPNYQYQTVNNSNRNSSARRTIGNITNKSNGNSTQLNNTSNGEKSDNKLKIFKSNPNFSNNKIINIIKKIKNKPPDDFSINQTQNNSNNLNLNVTCFDTNTNIYLDTQSNKPNILLNNTVSGNFYDVKDQRNQSKSGNKNRQTDSKSTTKKKIIESKSNNILSQTNIIETPLKVNEVYLNTDRNTSSNAKSLVKTNSKSNFNIQDNNKNINIEEDLEVNQSIEHESNIISDEGENISCSNKSENPQNLNDNKGNSNNSNSNLNLNKNVLKIKQIKAVHSKEDAKYWTNSKLKKEKNEIKGNFMITPKYNVISNADKIRINSSKEKIRDHLNSTNNKSNTNINNSNQEEFSSKNYGSNDSNLIMNLNNFNVNKNLNEILNNIPNNKNDQIYSLNSNNSNEIFDDHRKSENKISNNILSTNTKQISNLRNINTNNLINNNNLKRMSLKNTYNQFPTIITRNKIPAQYNVKIQGKNSKVQFNTNLSNNTNPKSTILVLDKCIENLKLALDNYIKASRTDKDLLKDIIRDNLTNIKKENEMQKSIHRENMKKEIQIQNNLTEFINMENNENCENLQKMISGYTIANYNTLSKEEEEENNVEFDENEFNKLSDNPEDIKNFIIKQLESFKLGLVKDRLDKYFEKLRDEHTSPRSDLCSSPMRHLIETTDEENRERQSEYEPMELDRSQMTQISLNGSLRKSLSNASNYLQEINNMNIGNSNSSNSLRGKYGSFNELINYKNSVNLNNDQILSYKDPKSKDKNEDLYEIAENSQEITDLASSRIDNNFNTLNNMTDYNPPHVTNIFNINTNESESQDENNKYDTYETLFNPIPNPENFKYQFEDLSEYNNINNFSSYEFKNFGANKELNDVNKKKNTIDVLTKEFMQRKLSVKDFSKKDQKISNLKKAMQSQQKNNY